jgi:acetyltransferase-like isoleucine patch superfamily enzyme
MSAHISASEITEGLWRYGRVDEQFVTETFRFHPTGVVTGYKHHNEVLWAIEDGILVVKNAQGIVTTRFDVVDRSGTTLKLRGTHLDFGGAIILQLESKGWTRTTPMVMKTSEHLKKYIADRGWKIGDHTYGGINLIDPNHANLEIGKFTSIADGCSVSLGDHRTDLVTSYPFAALRAAWPSAPDINDHTSHGDVVIGNDVWIGSSVFITSGVKIGDGAVIAAHAVVTKDVPSYAVYGGIPAKLIRYRFDSDIIETLLQIRWWDWPDHKVDEYLPLIMSVDVRKFIEAASK